MTADNGGVRRIAVLDAPSNLGLQPPTPGSVPGCAKAPGALRDHGLVARLGALDAGCVTAPRYDPGDWAPGDGVCQAGDVAGYSRVLADRLESLLSADRFPVVLGGDCSILLGSALALRRRGSATGRRYGLVFVDGHTDFRHPGNAEYVGAAAGEDLALVTGRGQPVLTDMDSLRPYFQPSDVVVLGIREDDEYKMDITAAGIASRTVPVLRAEGMPRTAAWAARLLADTAGFWVHLDADVLDPTVLPAVDAPSDGGIGYGELETLLADLVAAPNCLGIEVTVFDPDYDPTGRYAGELADALVAGLRPLWTRWADARPRSASVSGAVAPRARVTVPVGADATVPPWPGASRPAGDAPGPDGAVIPSDGADVVVAGDPSDAPGGAGLVPAGGGRTDPVAAHADGSAGDALPSARPVPEAATEGPGPVSAGEVRAAPGSTLNAADAPADGPGSAPGGGSRTGAAPGGERIGRAAAGETGSAPSGESGDESVPGSPGGSAPDVATPDGTRRGSALGWPGPVRDEPEAASGEPVSGDGEPGVDGDELVAGGAEPARPGVPTGLGWPA